jgi:AbiV family abortive infection protein
LASLFHLTIEAFLSFYLCSKSLSFDGAGIVVLKDSKNKWVEELEIRVELWKTMMQEILNGVIALTDSVEKLLNNGGDSTICSGLYTFAVEEYGKLLLLKDCTPTLGKVKIKYRNGFRSHTAKFNKAIQTLPKDCTTLHTGIFDEAIFDPEIFDSKEIADCETRQAVFYSDFTMDGQFIKRTPTVDDDLLKKAVFQLKTVALGITIP